MTRQVFWGLALIALSGSMVGCYAYLQRRSLVGDVVSHAVLPGVVLGYLVTASKSPAGLLVGALAAGALALYLVDLLTKLPRISQDTALSAVLVTFFSAGLLLLTWIQGMENLGDRAGLQRFLFGSALSISESDLIWLIGLAVFVIAVILLFYKDLLLVCFHRDYALGLGRPVRFLEGVLSLLIMLAIVLGIQAVGVVLMAAMLITPAAGARYWGNSFPLMLIISGLIGVLSALFGVGISAVSNIPTGPWVVLVATLLALVSFLIGPKGGWIARRLRHHRYSIRVREENLLKLLYHLGESDDDFYRTRSESELVKREEMSDVQIREGFRSLKRKQQVARTPGGWRLTERGAIQGRLVTKRHRLWELYLRVYLGTASDHVHEDAEGIEHVLTPEMEERLEALLNRPEVDPHGEVIPYQTPPDFA